ncbi:hypothetical protein Q1695_006785 [Nippostrongylus brasiliensis]|nr:hypothetical protein Q1695_006785 [Nippostrongylus brasiliensis]
MRRRHDAVTWKERWSVFKANRRKPGYLELIIYGLILNILGMGLLLLKAILDKDVIEATIQKRCILTWTHRRSHNEAGRSGVCSTHIVDRIVRNNTGEEKETFFEANSMIMVLITVLGRMANVIGTMKMYKGLGKFFSDRKRRKFRKATERVQNGETEVEFTELFSECCQIF